jgi:PAS domain S-box-containing protein
MSSDAAAGVRSSATDGGAGADAAAPAGPAPEAGARRRTRLPALIRRSLRWRIAFAISLTTITIVLLCGWFFFFYARGLLVERTSDALVGLAAAAVQTIPVDRLEAYLGTERRGNPDLTAQGILLTQLQEFADRVGVEDLYLMDRGNRVLLDARRRQLVGEEDYGLTLADPAVERAWTERRATAAPLFSRGDAGYRLAAFAPVIARDGRMLAMVGAERALPSLAVTDALRNRFLWIFAGGVLLSLLAAAAVSSSILKPVARLVRGIGATSPDGYPPSIPEDGQDEIGFLTREFNRLIADLKDKDAALRALYGREKARADLILASVPTGVIGVDALGTVRLWNAAAGSILGLEEGQALERGIAALPFPPTLTDALRQALEGTRTPIAELTWGEGPATRRLETAAVPYRDESGALLGAVALVGDVTERARLEEELRTRERLAALGEMSAGIAHEVRNPLAAMDGFAGLLARKLREPAEAELLEGIRREIEALNGIVTTFSRFARSPLLHRRRVDLRSLLNDLLPYYANRGVEITLDLDGVRTLNADPDEIRTVFANLLRNAVEAQPNGGSVTVEASFDAARGVHRVRVRDRGPGIPPEMAGRVFNPFFTTKAEGTGMGLALVHRIVTAHGGSVRLVAQEGPGTAFEIELPAEEA